MPITSITLTAYLIGLSIAPLFAIIDYFPNLTMLLPVVLLLIAFSTQRTSSLHNFIKILIRSLLNSYSLFSYLIISLNLGANDDVAINSFIFVTPNIAHAVS